MTTLTVEQVTTINKEDRKIKKTFTQGSYRVTVQTSFYKQSKRYVSTVAESRLEFRGDFTIEISQPKLFFSVGIDFYETVEDIKAINKYSFAILETVQATAIEKSEGIVKDLLAKGKTNTEIEEGK